MLKEDILLMMKNSVWTWQCQTIRRTDNNCIAYDGISRILGMSEQDELEPLLDQDGVHQHRI